MSAMCASCPLAAFHVLCMSYQLAMEWIHTCPIPARVIQFKAFWHLAIALLPNPSMCSYLSFWFGKRKLPIPFSSQIACPQNASVLQLPSESVESENRIKGSFWLSHCSLMVRPKGACLSVPYTAQSVGKAGSCCGNLPSRSVK